MSGQHRQLSSLVSLPRLSLAASPTLAPPIDLDVKLTPRPVYPVKIFIAAEDLQLVSPVHPQMLSKSDAEVIRELYMQGPNVYATQCQVHLQHDEVRHAVSQRKALCYPADSVSGPGWL